MNAAVSAEVHLSALEFDAYWELLGLDQRPPTLELPSPGRTWEQRRRILSDVLAELARRGLAGRRAPDQRLAAPLRLLARPEYQVDLRLVGPPHGQLVGIAAVGGEQGVVLCQRGGEIRMLGTPRARAVPTLLGLLGPVRPGVGRPVNIAAETYDAARAATADGSLWTMADELTARGVARVDASSWVRMCTGIRAFGQLGTAFWPAGVPRLGPWAIGFHLAESGHFLQLRRPARPHAPSATVTVCPVDAPGLHRLVDELLAAAPHHRESRDSAG